MAKYEVEVQGKLLDLLEQGKVSIVSNSMFITVEAEDDNEALAIVDEYIDDFCTGFVDEVKDDD